MRPRVLAHLLGLCNIVAGALLLFRPDLLLAGFDGVQTTAVRLLTTCVAVLLVAVAAGAWCLPPSARSTYLWVFGVGVKGAGAVTWAMAAAATGARPAWIGAAVDAAVALVIGAALILNVNRR